MVRAIFERFVVTGSATVLARELRQEGVRTQRGSPVDKKLLYRLLSNRVYLGEAVHKGTAIPASTPPSSTARSGTGCTPSCSGARANAPARPARRRRRC